MVITEKYGAMKRAGSALVIMAMPTISVIRYAGVAGGAWFGTMTMRQELTDIPNGYYSATCLAAAIEGEITNQRLFVKSFETSYSPIMTIGGDWNFQSWETMTTAIVAVIDGKLTIGFTSDNLNGGSTGNIGYLQIDLPLFSLFMNK